VPFFCPHPTDEFGNANIGVYAPFAGTITRVGYAFWATSVVAGTSLEIYKAPSTSLVNAANLEAAGITLVTSVHSVPVAADDRIVVNAFRTAGGLSSGGGIVGYVEFTPA
jgi:hypothetical protein